jgi:transmembrane sensor
MSRDAEASAWFARMRGPDADEHRAAFETWRRDPGNAAAYAEAESDWLMVGGVAPAHIAARGPSRTIARCGPMRWAFATIAAAAIAIGFAWYNFGSNREQQLAERTVRDGDFHLPDGSTVWLADGARAEVRYAPNERRILLVGGRAKFEVAHDAARPFIVEAGGSETIALGTIFTVDARQKAVIVELARGSVEVRAIGTGSKVRLAPGERARVADRQASLVPAMQAPVKSSVIDADRTTLADVIEQANRVNAVQIGLADPALGKRELSGRFDVADSASLARKLAVALDLVVETSGDAIIISAKDEKAGG